MSKLITVLSVVAFVGASAMSYFADVTVLFGLDIGRVLVILFAVGAMPIIWGENAAYDEN